MSTKRKFSEIDTLGGLENTIPQNVGADAAGSSGGVQGADGAPGALATDNKRRNLTVITQTDGNVPFYSSVKELMDVGALLVVSRSQLRQILTNCLLGPGISVIGTKMELLQSLTLLHYVLSRRLGFLTSLYIVLENTLNDLDEARFFKIGNGLVSICELEVEFEVYHFDHALIVTKIDLGQLAGEARGFEIAPRRNASFGQGGQNVYKCDTPLWWTENRNKFYFNVLVEDSMRELIRPRGDVVDNRILSALVQISEGYPRAPEDIFSNKRPKKLRGMADFFRVTCFHQANIMRTVPNARMIERGTQTGALDQPDSVAGGLLQGGLGDAGAAASGSEGPAVGVGVSPDDGLPAFTGGRRLTVRVPNATTRRPKTVVNSPVPALPSLDAVLAQGQEAMVDAAGKVELQRYLAMGAQMGLTMFRAAGGPEEEVQSATMAVQQFLATVGKGKAIEPHQRGPLNGPPPTLEPLGGPPPSLEPLGVQYTSLEPLGGPTPLPDQLAGPPPPLEALVGVVPCVDDAVAADLPCTVGGQQAGMGGQQDMPGTLPVPHAVNQGHLVVHAAAVQQPFDNVRAGGSGTAIGEPGVTAGATPALFQSEPGAIVEVAPQADRCDPTYNMLRQMVHLQQQQLQLQQRLLLQRQAGGTHAPPSQLTTPVSKLP